MRGDGGVCVSVWLGVGSGECVGPVCNQSCEDLGDVGYVSVCSVVVSA